MKTNRWTSILTMVFVCLSVLAFSSFGYAARTKGRVSMSAPDNIDVCTALIRIFKDDKQEVKSCTVKGDVAGITGIRGPLPKKIKVGQAVILRVRGAKKVMGTVVAVLDNAADPDKIARLILKEDARVIWHEDGGRICLIKVRKKFEPDVDATVKLKVRSAMSRIEGC